MLAYLSWHRAASGVDTGAYEDALERFHRSLAHRPPSGFRGSRSFRLAELPWLEERPAGDAAAGYEDWYLLEDWAAVGVLEESAVSRGHLTAHHEIARRAGYATGAIYRLLEGGLDLGSGLAVWVTRPAGHADASLGALLGDGMSAGEGGLWRRCLGLGPASEYCLLAAEAPAGVAASRLPAGWSARIAPREALWEG